VPKKSQPKVDTSASNTLQMTMDSADRPRLIAQLAATPTLQAASTIKRWSRVVGDDLDITGLVDELRQQAATASRGDLQRQEAMLTAQAHTLDTLFNELARRSALNVGEYLDAAERYMRLALKAQSQCRATIETLAEIKNPRPVAFVQQANIAHNQQVNNGGAEPSRARETENQQSKLLEQTHGERLDTRAPETTGGVNPQLETLGAVQRTKNGGREGESG
jgi:hypothetical protein